jgi:uncharacterized membrane-anchored protein
MIFIVFPFINTEWPYDVKWLDSDWQFWLEGASIIYNFLMAVVLIVGLVVSAAYGYWYIPVIVIGIYLMVGLCWALSSLYSQYRAAHPKSRKPKYIKPEIMAQEIPPKETKKNSFIKFLPSKNNKNIS